MAIACHSPWLSSTNTTLRVLCVVRHPIMEMMRIARRGMVNLYIPFCPKGSRLHQRLSVVHTLGIHIQPGLHVVQSIGDAIHLLPESVIKSPWGVRFQTRVCTLHTTRVVASHLRMRPSSTPSTICPLFHLDPSFGRRIHLRGEICPLVPFPSLLRWTCCGKSPNETQDPSAAPWVLQGLSGNEGASWAQSVL